MNTAPTITTERLTLRMPVADDFALIGPVLMSEHARYMAGPYDLAGAWQEFCMDVAGWWLNGAGAWSVVESRSGALAGAVMLTIRPDFPERELGWYLLPGAVGRGIAFEAAQAARTYAFDRLGWSTMVSYICPENVRSIALAERLGAVRDEAAARPDPDDLVFRHPRPGRPA